MNGTKYTEHLINSISQSKQIAINEVSSLGLNEETGQEKISQWYDKIINWVTDNPPQFYVKYLEIMENTDSAIQKINYLYFSDAENVSGSAIKIISDLYGD